MASISVFGLGYVGTVMLACFADNGHKTIGVDISPLKTEMIQQGVSPIIEEGLTELLNKGVTGGQIQAICDPCRAVADTDISFICVGTPSNANGSLDLRYVERVCQEIGEALALKSGYHIVVLRSTVLPGSMEQVVIPILEQASGKQAGREFGVAFNPEFLREGTSIKDFYEPPFTVIGCDDARVAEQLRPLYSELAAPIFITPIKVAEMVKYANNAFHALKVTFANEIGNLCHEQRIDSHQVMKIFCQDHKLNLSPYYLMPGFAFGGSCLPKDLRAIVYQAHKYDIEAPVLESILLSNQRQIEIAIRMIKQTGHKRVGVLGLSFKAGTDDLRESPMVDLIEHLIGKGFHVQVYDKNVSLANLHGANRVYIEKEIPHIASLMCQDLDQVLEESEVIVIGNKAPEFPPVLGKLRQDQILIDFVRIQQDLPSNGHYQGICW